MLIEMPSGFKFGKKHLRFFKSARDGEAGIAMIAEGIERGGRNSVDSIGADQVININGIGIGGIFRASGCPQRTLHARAETRFERCKTRGCKNGFKCIIGKFCICNGGFAAQRRIFGKARINFGIDTRDKERCNRCNYVDWMILRDAVFKACEIGIHHFGITIQAKR